MAERNAVQKVLPVIATILVVLGVVAIARLNVKEKDVVTPPTTLLRFLRREPFGRVLLLTASTDVFAAASHAVSVTLQQAPLSKEPHGSETIFALLS